MCTQRTKDDLYKYLNKGTFPGTSSMEIHLWNCLLTLLETDADKTVGDINPNYFTNVIIVNKVQLNTGMTSTATFLGYAHARLCADFATASKDPLQTLIQRLRNVTSTNNALTQSKIQLTMDADTLMGNGLVANPLTYVPDPVLGVTFGSTPDQLVIGNEAPVWAVLKRRAYENTPLTQYGGKPHYVLAHLLNHQINGPGANKLNVVPFWATANTQMATKAEKYVKELVQRGIVVNYTIQQGSAVGLTTGRTKLLKDIPKMGKNDPPIGDRTVQAQLVEYEQYLPDRFVINCDALDFQGNWVNIVNNVSILNYVPETVPYLL